MPRDLVLGNGKLLVCLDRNLCIRDLYWPYVGLYNHLSGHKIRFGVWVEGQFAWIDDHWDRTIKYRPYSLVSDCHLYHEGMDIGLSVTDTVDYQTDLFLRQITVRNPTARRREVRLFLAADLFICETDIGDTCYYDPYARAVLHYKRDNYFLLGGQNGLGQGLHGFACGMKGLAQYGMEGTWRDCEDGDLSGNPIAQGSVDSALSLAVVAEPHGEAAADFWIAVGPTREAVLEIQTALRRQTVAAVVDTTEQYWRAWVYRGLAPGVVHPEAGVEHDLSALPPRIAALFRRSLLIIRTQIDDHGAILAANDTDIMKTNRAHYSYMWPRDGALVAHALDRAGYGRITRRFFEFCRAVLPRERAALMHKYGPDGSVGASWHSWTGPDGTPEAPLQEDETALPLWALWRHYEKHRDFEFTEEMYRTFARPCADFLLAYRDPATGLPKPSWDLWEERRGIHTYTVCAVIAALEAMARFARLFGDRQRTQRYEDGAREVRDGLRNHLWAPDHHRFARRIECHADGSWSRDMTQDASLHALHLFDVLPLEDPMLQETMRQVNDRLWVKAGIGGMARYEGDYYARISDDLANVPGNPWIICTLWRAQWQIKNARARADLEAPCHLLEWTDLCALPSGVLPEQIHPYDFTPLTVAPLTWSHSEVIETVYLWLQKRAELDAQAGQETHVSLPKGPA